MTGNNFRSVCFGQQVVQLLILHIYQLLFFKPDPVNFNRIIISR